MSSSTSNVRSAQTNRERMARDFSDFPLMVLLVQMGFIGAASLRYAHEQPQMSAAEFLDRVTILLGTGFLLAVIAVIATSIIYCGRGGPAEGMDGSAPEQP